VVGGTRVIANPHGYTHVSKVRGRPARIEREVEDFDPGLIVEVTREHAYTVRM
jgi:hypothetical protein